ncbi:MAG: ferredoxin [Lachnospiraceae bacterium]
MSSAKESEIQAVCAAYFSATGTTRKVVCQIAQSIASALGIPCQEADFTLPSGRTQPLRFTCQTLVVAGTPVYAGRVPNILLPFLNSMQGNGAICIPVVVYGNRHYDDALLELWDITQTAGFSPIAAAAFVGEHAFSRTLGQGRPDAEDYKSMRQFASMVVHKLHSNDTDSDAPQIPGTPRPYRGYYTPKDRTGQRIDIRKVTPLTGSACTQCGLCAQLCPMGSISTEDASQYTGICIKCAACFKQCPVGAKHYLDEGYLYHTQELEQMYRRRAPAELFV